MKYLVSLFILSITVSSHTMAGSFEEECDDFKTCVDKIAELTGQKYFYALDEQDQKLESSSNLELTAKNAENLFSHALFLNGLARIPINAQNVYKIIKQRDLRYQTLPRVKYNSGEPVFSPHPDYFEFTYDVLDPELTEQLFKALRPITSPHARIISTTNQLIIMDTALNLKRMYRYIKNVDN